MAALQEKSNPAGKVLILKNMSKMSVNCKSCGKSFDSTFTVAEYESLPAEQYEAGTLHLCPYCGFLGTYLLKDYEEERN